MPKPKIITIAHTKGGVGKSTLAWNIATTLLATGAAVSVIDLDYQKTLYYIDRLREYDRLAPLPPMGVRSISTVAELDEALSYLIDPEYIVIDVGGFDSELNRAAISVADMVICPIKDSVHEALGFHAFSAVLCDIGSPVVHLLINGAHPRTSDFSSLRESVGEYAGMVWMDTIVHFRAAYARAMARGRGVVEYDNTAHFAVPAEQIRSVVREIQEVLKCPGN